LNEGRTAVKFSCWFYFQMIIATFSQAYRGGEQLAQDKNKTRSKWWSLEEIYISV